MMLLEVTPNMMLLDVSPKLTKQEELVLLTGSTMSSPPRFYTFEGKPLRQLQLYLFD